MKGFLAETTEVAEKDFLSFWVRYSNRQSRTVPGQGFKGSLAEMTEVAEKELLNFKVVCLHYNKYPDMCRGHDMIHFLQKAWKFQKRLSKI